MENTKNITWKRQTHPNGSIWWEVPYVDGKRHGLERGWDRDGSLRWEAPYVDGNRHGLERWWYQDGSLKVVGLFNDDVLLCLVRFPEGKIHHIKKLTSTQWKALRT